MVYDQSDGNILDLICLIRSMCKFTNLIPQSLHRIHIKD